jgi:hypothetical protein
VALSVFKDGVSSYEVQVTSQLADRQGGGEVRRGVVLYFSTNIRLSFYSSSLLYVYFPN